MIDKLLTTGEVARRLNVSVAWCEYHRWKGDSIPFIRIGTRTIRYRESVVEAYISGPNNSAPTTPKNGGSNGK